MRAANDAQQAAGAGPAELLAAVLDALRENDEGRPDAGVAFLWSVASDRMALRVGDESALGRALHNELYAPLLGHREVRTSEIERVGDSARQLWTVVGRAGESARYTVAVARQRHGERRGRWAVSGLVREGVDL